MSANRGSFVLLLALCAVIAGTGSAQARVVQAGQLQETTGARLVDAGVRHHRALELSGAMASIGVRAGGLVRLRVQVSACASTARLSVAAGTARVSRVVRAGSWRTVAVRLPAKMSAVRLAATAAGRPACRAARLKWVAGRVALVATARGSSIATPATSTLRWGLIGNRVDRTAEERAAGLSFKVVRLSWKDFEPSDGVRSASYVEAKRQEIAALAANGMRVVLDLGLQDTPQWLHKYSNSYLVNQYGERWTSATDGDLAIDKSDANLIFNAELRKRAAGYTADALGLFGAGAMAVRIGGGRYNELGYPAARTAANANTYWAYDALAQAGSPVRGWKPGSPSANGEAGRFLEYYLGALEKFQRWQIATARRAFAGPLIVLHPSWGLRPGQASGAVARNLDGSTSAEINGEVQRGHDVARFVAAVADPLVYPATTWLDAPYGSDASANMADWRPVHYLADLAARHPSHPQVWGENTGQADRAAVDFSAAQARRFGVGGLSWYREEELFSGSFATLDDLRGVIAATH